MCHFFCFLDLFVLQCIKQKRSKGDRMENLDILNEDGTISGVIKERSQVHRDGDLHRTSHVWIARKNNKSGMDILLQKRSQNKDSYPGCYDISSAGHIVAGCGFLDSAIRELKEELGLMVEKEELILKGTRRFSFEEIFHDKLFCDNQLSNVYLLWRDFDEKELTLQIEEIESVIWMDFKDCIHGVENKTFPNCIVLEELKMLV